MLLKKEGNDENITKDVHNASNELKALEIPITRAQAMRSKKE